MAKTALQRLETLARRHEVLDRQTVARAGIHTQALTRLVAAGSLERVGPGLYRSPAAPVTEHHGLVVASAANPYGVICLLSALSFHGIGTQLPAEVWIAIERGRATPTLPDLSLRVVRYSGDAFHEGIEVHRVEHQKIRVYSVAKTLADLFKARNRMGVEVAIEALRDAWQSRRFTMAELDRAARACRVERVMKPYVEGITA